MKICKNFNNFVIVILVLKLFVKSEATFGHHHKHYETTKAPNSKYNFKTETIANLDPKTKIDIVKYYPTDESKLFFVLKKDDNFNAIKADKTKRNDLVSIAKAWQEKTSTSSVKTTTTTLRPISATTPQSATSVNVHNDVVNGHSFVYNIQNYGTHYHTYDHNGKEQSTPHNINIVPLEEY